MRISSSVALGRGIKRLFLAVRQGKDEKCWDAEAASDVPGTARIRWFNTI